MPTAETTLERIRAKAADKKSAKTEIKDEVIELSGSQVVKPEGEKMPSTSSAIDRLKGAFKISKGDFPSELPEGVYQVEVTEVEWIERKDNTSADLRVKMIITSDEQKGVIKYETFALLDDEKSMRGKIARANFVKFIKGVGIEDIDVFDLDELEQFGGKEVVIVVKHSVSKQTGRIFDNVVAWHKVEA